MSDFLTGIVAMGFSVASVFFLRFWVRTQDSLFMIFAVSFGLLALEQGLVAWQGVYREEHAWTYLLRLAAFVLIIVAVVRKNNART